MRQFLWDFFGPRAEQTARHFQKHLDEFLQKNAVAGCETGVASEQPGHFAVFCRAPLSLQDMLVRSLRPQRML